MTDLLPEYDVIVVGAGHELGMLDVKLLVPLRI